MLTTHVSHVSAYEWVGAIRSLTYVPACNGVNFTFCCTIALAVAQYMFNPYPTTFPYGNGMVLHFYQQQESSTTKTVHKVINKGLKTYV